MRRVVRRQVGLSDVREVYTDGSTYLELNDGRWWHWDENGNILDSGQLDKPKTDWTSIALIGGAAVLLVAILAKHK